MGVSLFKIYIYMYIQGSGEIKYSVYSKGMVGFFLKSCRVHGGFCVLT